MTLMQRIHRAGQEVEPVWEDRDVERVWQGLRRKRRRRSIVAKAGVAALATTAAAVWALLLVFPGREGNVEPVARSAPSSHRDQTMRFADGSTAVPWAWPRHRCPSSRTPRCGSSCPWPKVVHASTSFHRADRVFAVRAGEVTVSVLGTAFSVERVADRVGVAVTRGAVQVDWGAGARQLVAGEDGWFPPLVTAPPPSERRADVTARPARPILRDGARANLGGPAKIAANEAKSRRKPPRRESTAQGSSRWHRVQKPSQRLRRPRRLSRRPHMRANPARAIVRWPAMATRPMQQRCWPTPTARAWQDDSSAAPRCSSAWFASIPRTRGRRSRRFRSDVFCSASSAVRRMRLGRSRFLAGWPRRARWLATRSHARRKRGRARETPIGHGRAKPSTGRGRKVASDRDRSPGIEAVKLSATRADGGAGSAVDPGDRARDAYAAGTAPIRVDVEGCPPSWDPEIRLAMAVELGDERLSAGIEDEHLAAPGSTRTNAGGHELSVHCDGNRVQVVARDSRSAATLERTLTDSLPAATGPRVVALVAVELLTTFNPAVRRRGEALAESTPPMPPAAPNRTSRRRHFPLPSRGIELDGGGSPPVSHGERCLPDRFCRAADWTPGEERWTFGAPRAPDAGQRPSASRSRVADARPASVRRRHSLLRRARARAC